MTSPKQAIVYMLRRIQEHPQLAYYAGSCTQAHENLCEALSTLTGQSLKEIKHDFQPKTAAPAPEGWIRADATLEEAIYKRARQELEEEDAIKDDEKDEPKEANADTPLERHVKETLIPIFQEEKATRDLPLHTLDAYELLDLFNLIRD